MGLGTDGVDEQMINALLIGAILVFLATVLVIGVRGYADKFESLDQLSLRISPVNVEALRNLLDPVQDEYFAQNLASSDLRWVRRERNLAAIEYVWRIARNSAQVIRVAELASKSASPEIASAGIRISNDALQTRLLALKTVSILVAGLVFPGRPLHVPVIQQYSSLNAEVYSLREISQSRSA
jgi:hypothetical protein